MSADKRSVATDALETLGTIIDDNQKRDAIHLAVEPIEAAHDMIPGDDVGIIDGKASTAAPEKLGIVDPFLTAMVKAGEKFWLVVYPRRITSLRHVWSHPAFAEIDELADLKKAEAQKSASKEASKAFLEEYAANLFSYYGKGMYGEAGHEDALALLLKNAKAGYFPTDIDSPWREPTEEFWQHYENYTGEIVLEKPEYFSCSC